MPIFKALDPSLLNTYLLQNLAVMHNTNTNMNTNQRGGIFFLIVYCQTSEGHNDLYTQYCRRLYMNINEPHLSVERQAGLHTFYTKSPAA